MSKREVVEFLKAKKVEQGKATIKTEQERKVEASNKSVNNRSKDNRIRVM